MKIFTNTILILKINTNKLVNKLVYIFTDQMIKFSTFFRVNMMIGIFYQLHSNGISQKVFATVTSIRSNPGISSIKEVQWNAGM